MLIPQKVCSYCRKPNHWKADCEKLGRINLANQYSGLMNCCNQIGTINNRYRQPFNPNGSMFNTNYLQSREGSGKEQTDHIVMIAVVSCLAPEGSTDINTSEWIVDSGCSHHMSPNEANIVEYGSLHVPVYIKIGNNSRLKAVGCGKVITTLCTRLL